MNNNEAITGEVDNPTLSGRSGKKCTVSCVVVVDVSPPLYNYEWDLGMSADLLLQRPWSQQAHQNGVPGASRVRRWVSERPKLYMFLLPSVFHPHKWCHWRCVDVQCFYLFPQKLTSPHPPARSWPWLSPALPVPPRSVHCQCWW